MRRFLSSWISFSMLAFIVNISAMAVVHAGSLYADLDDNNIYIHSITELSTEKVIKGYEDGTYKSEQSINRAEFLKVALSWYSTEVKTLSFKGSNCYTDVADQWFAPYVCAATELGIVKGYDDRSFHPEYPINFVEASKIIVTLFDFPTAVEEGENWYQNYVEAMESHGLILPTIIVVDQAVDRGETAEMIHGATQATSGKWESTYDDLKTGALGFYRVVYSSPGGSLLYAYLIDGTIALYLAESSYAQLNPTQTQVAYLESKDEISTLTVKDVATNVALHTLTDIGGGEAATAFAWSENGEQVRWTAISYENTEFDGVVVVNQANLASNTVSEFETNSLFHCDGGCTPYPFVWAKDKNYGAILTFSYDEADDENFSFLIYNSLGQEIGTTAPLKRLNEAPSIYVWDDSGEALIATYDDGTSETIAVAWK